MKSNKPCYYCGMEVKGQRQHFCSEVCNTKYWRGVYSNKWKRGQFIIKEGDSPTQEELERSKKVYKARKLAYKKYKKGEVIKCDLCHNKSKIIHRHHEDYNKPEICLVVCPKCHGLINRYNNLLHTLKLERGEE